MFHVGGAPILTDELEVLQELKAQLAMNGVQLFATFKRSGNNIQFNCPVHNNGLERKPSCGISLHNTEKTPAGTVHCFACGYTATLEEMVSHCFGRNDDGQFGKDWLIKNFLILSVESRKDIILDFGRDSGRKTSENEVSYISDEELDSYRYYHPYMYERKLNDDIIEMFDVGYDKNFKLNDKFGKVKSTLRCLTFPVRDIDGNTLFIARRSVDIKFFHYPEGIDKPVYGLYELGRHNHEATELIVCESILNALVCWVYGRPAVALLGLGTQLQYEQLARLGCRKLIAGFDPDEAGARATMRLRRAMQGRKLVTEYQIPEGKDINDLGKEEFENLSEIF